MDFSQKRTHFCVVPDKIAGIRIEETAIVQHDNLIPCPTHLTFSHAALSDEEQSWRLVKFRRKSDTHCVRERLG